ncbi:MAG: LysR family transcriptional regulator [Rhodospirillaceae bacterium]|nr:LysR family transcriptional regulator [Rhodospirillaceae bacterium]
MTIALRHLRAFLAVAERASVTGAAALLRRTQSAVSRSVHLLEQAVDAPLFERHAAGMALTRFGAALRQRGEAAAAEFAALAGDLQRLGAGRPPAGSPVVTLAVDNSRLDALIALVDAGHMADAARRLGITQPAVSASIRLLESALGARLFERGLHGLAPTPVGEALALRTKRAYAELRHAEADIAAIKGAHAGNIAVGALPFGRTALLPQAILRVLAAHPALRIATTEGPFDTLVRRLREGEIDFIFGALREPPPAEDIAGEPVLADHLALLVRAGHPLAGRRRIAAAQLGGYGWILPRRGTPARALLEAALLRRGMKPLEDVVETSSSAMVRGLAMESDRIAALSRHQLELEIAQGLLVALDFDLSETARPIGLICRVGARPSPGAALLMQAIRDVAAERRAPAMKQVRRR